MGAREVKQREVWRRNNEVSLMFPQLLLGNEDSFFRKPYIKISATGGLSFLSVSPPLSQVILYFEKKDFLWPCLQQMLLYCLLTLHLQNSLRSLTSVNTVYGLQHKLGDFFSQR